MPFSQLMRMLAVGVILGAMVMLAPGMAAEEPAEPELCELHIAGDHVVCLEVLVDKKSRLRFPHPGDVLRLPAGEYAVVQVKLEGDYETPLYPDGIGERFELAPGRPYTLGIGTPLSPKVELRRDGPCVQLDFYLLDAAGHDYQKQCTGATRPEPPRFLVSKDGRPLGGASFEYG